MSLHNHLQPIIINSFNIFNNPFHISLLKSQNHSLQVQLVTSRQEQKDADLNRRRALSMIGGKMQVISRIQEEEERKTLFTGNSLKITALQTESERQQNREATIQGDNAILITATNNYQNIHENEAVEEVRHSQSPDLSDYSLFEARRKAEAERAAAAEIPKLSSLHPISRPRRASPVHHAEEDNVAMVGVYLYRCIYCFTLIY